MKSNVKYLVTGAAGFLRDFSRMVSDEAGCRRVGMFLPIWAANMMGGLMEMQARKKGTKPLMTRFSVYNLARNNKFDSTKAVKELGYSTRSYRDTIRDEIRWLKAEGKIA